MTVNKASTSQSSTESLPLQALRRELGVIQTLINDLLPIASASENPVVQKKISELVQKQRETSRAILAEIHELEKKCGIITLESMGSGLPIELIPPLLTLESQELVAMAKARNIDESAEAARQTIEKMQKWVQDHQEALPAIIRNSFQDFLEETPARPRNLATDYTRGLYGCEAALHQALFNNRKQDALDAYNEIKALLAQPDLPPEGRLLLQHIRNAMIEGGLKHEYSNPALIDDRHVALAAVSGDHHKMRRLAPKWQKDPQIAMVFLRAISPWDMRGPEELDPSLLANRDFTLQAVRICPQAFRFADHSLKNDPQVALEALKAGRGEAWYDSSNAEERNKEGSARVNFSSVSNELKANREFIMAAIPLVSFKIKEIGENLQNDREIALLAVKNLPSNASELVPELKNDRAFCLDLVRANGLALEHLNPDFKRDPEIVRAAVTQNGQALRFAPDFQNDEEMVRAAIASDGSAIGYADPQFLGNKPLLLEALKNVRPHLLSLYSRPVIDSSSPFLARVLNDPEVATAMIRSKMITFLELPRIQKSNRELALLAIDHIRSSEELALIQLWPKDRDIILKALSVSGNAARYLTPEMEIDDEMVRAAVQAPHGLALRYLPAQWKDNKAIVLLAMRANPEQFQFVSQTLKNDPDVVLAALRPNYVGPLASLQNAELLKNKDFMLEAVQIGPEAARYLDRTLESDRDFIRELVRKVPACRHYIYPGLQTFRGE